MEQHMNLPDARLYPSTSSLKAKHIPWDDPRINNVQGSIRRRKCISKYTCRCTVIRLIYTNEFSRGLGQTDNGIHYSTGPTMQAINVLQEPIKT